MFQQYHQLKQGNPNAILFFRMGDFYEVFFDDAKTCARELDLTLTARNKNDPNPIPMAGVPHHAAAGYVQALVEKGYRVAIAEQVEDPAQAKGLVRREVIRVVTPGVVLDPTSLAQRDPNYLVAVAQLDDRYGLAFVDLSTGEVRSTEVPMLAQVIAELHRMEPAEALLGPGLGKQTALVKALRGVLISDVDPDAFGLTAARLEVASLLGAPLPVSGAALCACGAALRYGREVSGGELRNVHEIRVYETAGFMRMDEATRRNLELFRTLLGGQRKGSLLHLLDRTRTAIGGRMLREWLAFPLLDVKAIHKRQQAVAALVDQYDIRESLQDALTTVADIERIGARVAQGTAHARDLAALMRSLAAVPEVVKSAGQLRPLETVLPRDLCDDLYADLSQWLVDDPPISLTDGGLLREGAHAELDELIRISVDGVGVITRLEEQEKQQTGISSLKIRKNKVFGYYIEVSRSNLHRVPERYLRKQTLSNAERYITEDLKELEEKVLGADERRKSLEYALFTELRDRMAGHSARLQRLARQLATLDALCGLADAAVRYRWVAPKVDQSLVIDIKRGRHPVVEQSLDDERFVPNDILLDSANRQLVILTGPNMAGKSTTMRQVALIALLAQMGSFVPADAARIGITDQVFTRVGAADDLSKGQSTFMVEMAETAHILHNATERSLILLDEIGRGTSTYDGLSIAWAVAEDLAGRLRSRAIFATHYHELCDLADEWPAVVNQSVAVSEFGDQILFLRRLKQGGASRSYGIQCARLAGLPEAVVERARTLLKRFEKVAPRNDRNQLSLFNTAAGGAETPQQTAEPTAPPHPALMMLQDTDPDDLTPRAAHELVYQLKALLTESP